MYLGKHVLARVEAGEQVREVARAIPHPRYQSSPTHLNHDHDIMLLELKSAVQLTRHIQTLPLSRQRCLPPGTCCRVSGWGTTTSPQGTRPHGGRGDAGETGGPVGAAVSTDRTRFTRHGMSHESHSDI